MAFNISHATRAVETLTATHAAVIDVARTLTTLYNDASDTSRMLNNLSNATHRELCDTQASFDAIYLASKKSEFDPETEATLDRLDEKIRLLRIAALKSDIDQDNADDVLGMIYSTMTSAHTTLHETSIVFVKAVKMLADQQGRHFDSEATLADIRLTHPIYPPGCGYSEEPIRYFEYIMLKNNRF